MARSPSTLPPLRLRRPAVLALLIGAALVALAWFVAGVDPGGRRAALDGPTTTAGAGAPPVPRAADLAPPQRPVDRTDHAHGPSRSEREAVAAAPLPEPPSQPREVRLTVLDGTSGEPLHEVTAYRLDVAVTRPSATELAARFATREDGTVVLDVTTGRIPGPHILDVPHVQRGPSPLLVDARTGTEVWITGPRHAWARLALFDEWPAELTVVLPRGAALDVVVTGSLEYETVYVTLRRAPDEADRDARSGAARRRTRDGTASFDGLEPGTYVVSVVGVMAEDKIETLEREVRITDGGAHRVVLDLEPNWGALGVRLTDPVPDDEFAGVLEVRYRPNTVDPSTSTTAHRVILKRAESANAASIVWVTEEPMPTPAGAGVLEILPHGVRWPVLVHPGPETWVDRELPVRVMRTVRVRTEAGGEVWSDHMTVVPAEGDESPLWRRPLMTVHADRADGAVVARWPTTPFTIVPPLGQEWVEPALATWSGGEAMPEDLTLHVREAQLPPALLVPGTRRIGGTLWKKQR